MISKAKGNHRYCKTNWSIIDRTVLLFLLYDRGKKITVLILHLFAYRSRQCQSNRSSLSARSLQNVNKKESFVVSNGLADLRLELGAVKWMLVSSRHRMWWWTLLSAYLCLVPRKLELLPRSTWTSVISRLILSESINRCIIERKQWTVVASVICPGSSRSSRKRNGAGARVKSRRRQLCHSILHGHEKTHRSSSLERLSFALWWTIEWAYVNLYAIDEEVKFYDVTSS